MQQLLLLRVQLQRGLRRALVVEVAMKDGLVDHGHVQLLEVVEMVRLRMLAQSHLNLQSCISSHERMSELQKLEWLQEHRLRIELVRCQYVGHLGWGFAEIYQ